MNFLAHIYLSGENDHVKVGNFIGDWIKGNDHNKYPADIQKGILLHRSIDSFTDNHPIVKKSKNRLNDKYHKYSGIIIDIFYDHFLAHNWKLFSDIELIDYTRNLNHCLISNMSYLPADIQEFIPRFMKRRWIESYATLEGIEHVLMGMSRYTSLPDKTADAINILKNEYEGFKSEFFEYFPLLEAHVVEKFQIEIVHP
ncbi:MAG TPA: ACP phosphodiesterase [Bacteroidales bacterium]